MSRKLLVPMLLAFLAVALVDGHALGSNGASNDKNFMYQIGLWGDLPYSDLQAQTGVPNLIADMNSQDLAFTVHDGDLKAGSATVGSVTPTTCVDALYTQALNYFNSLKAPAMFTTGDNDWTDCDRGSNLNFNSLERLDHERQVFFSTPNSLGQRTLTQEVQTDQTCLSFNGYVNPALPKVNDNTTPDLNQASNTNTKPVACAENRRWTYQGVTYVIVDVQGSCNNRCDKDPNDAEWAARTAADIKWLQDSFAEAKANHSAAVMILSQADPGFDGTGAHGEPQRNPATLVEGIPNNDPVDGFHDFLSALRTEVINFQRPVAYVHGDSHYFRIDKPFLDSQGRRLENFTRVETFGDNQGNGDNDVNWVKALVDPKSRDVFAFQTQIVPGNRVAVPAPLPLN